VDSRFHGNDKKKTGMTDEFGRGYFFKIFEEMSAVKIRKGKEEMQKRFCDWCGKEVKGYYSVETKGPVILQGHKIDVGRDPEEFCSRRCEILSSANELRNSVHTLSEKDGYRSMGMRFFCEGKEVPKEAVEKTGKKKYRLKSKFLAKFLSGKYF
jgi:hypothetical protein